MKHYLDLFCTFAKIGVCTFGGGYAMLPILDRELVERKGWVTTEQLADYYAIGQCTPGVIAVNTATFVGIQQAGVWGGIVATLGLVFPSVLIITLLAAFLSGFAHLPMVIHAFGGIRAGVVALILSAIIRLAKSTLVDTPTRIMYGVVLVLSTGVLLLPPLPGAVVGWVCAPVPLVVVSGVAGVLVRSRRPR